MPKVEVSEEVAVAADSMYQVLCDFTRFPDFMKNVDSVTLREKGDGYAVSEWVTRLQGARFQWTERDEFFPADRRITYRQLQGDLKTFQGYWQLEETARGTRVTLVTEFEFGIPMLAALLNPVAKIAIRENAREMVRSLATAAAG
ncbi:MAG: aromatase/cyclase [Thermaerobacter sp.]|nr:aromatase/cyclase [Thermaerobacter sp.]